MIKKINCELFVTEDGKEFYKEELAVEHAIKCVLAEAKGVYLGRYEIEAAIKALLGKFTITPRKDI